MKSHNRFPALDEACETFAHAVASADAGESIAFASATATQSTHATIAKILACGRVDRIEELGRARLGFQYISKLRIRCGENTSTIVCRWREENGAWRIAEIEDLTGKRSSWSDLMISASGASHA